MGERVRIDLQPLGRSIEVERGSALRDLLFTHGVEFPCGGRGQCRGCRVRVSQGALPVTPAQRERLTPEEIADGWRLACCSTAESDLSLEVAQWRAAILADDSPFDFAPRPGLGVAVDLGTTTLVAQLVDLQSGRVLAVETALNPQARHGADVMSRVHFAVAEGGHGRLKELIRGKIGRLVERLLERAKTEGSRIVRILIVGNTVMHHLFCGIDLEPLSRYPFKAVRDGLEVLRAPGLGWEIDGDPDVRFLPCLGGFVGSDVLAGVLATRMQASESLLALVDLGTNGEIIVGNRHRMLCASTAAGPAFEGARISVGMRASTGAICQVRAGERGLECQVMGGGEPRGICGSGLVDAVAAGLELGLVDARGRIAGNRSEWMLAPPVALTQCDIRELQLAKAAVAAGIRILLERLGATTVDVARVYLAGAFGNYVSRHSARRIGLLDFPSPVVEPAGNTALCGAKMALFFSDREEETTAKEIRSRVEHVPLSNDPRFLDTYVEEMAFPESAED